uniref:Nidogen 2 n=1 Tax=Pelodiscus sinensis TaxID=13735 RepID=K7FUV6_PELSI
VGTNGIISTQDFPRETQYVDDDFPTDFPAIAPFLSDIDTSGGRGKVFYREEESPEVLAQAAGLIQAAFPGAFSPTRAFIATWEDVGAYEEVSGNAAPTEKLNTFQAVLAYNDSDSYALFLYPADGLQFFGTRPKESYNVQLELPARVGFSRGDTAHLKGEGPYYTLTSSEQSVKNLYQTSNSGIPGVWAFHIGSTSLLDNVVPARVGEKPSEGRSWEPPESTLGSAAVEQIVVEADYPDENIDYPDPFYSENEDDDLEYPTEPEPEVPYGEPGRSGTRLASELESTLPAPVSSPRPAFPEVKSVPSSPGLKERPSQVPPLEGEVESSQETGVGSPTSLETSDRLLELTTEGLAARPGEDHAQPYPDGDTVPSERDVFPAYPEGEVVLQGHSENYPPLSRGRQVVGVDEDGSFNPEGFTYHATSTETCAWNHGQCSPHGFCTPYATGFCCHCQAKFYGNGRHCPPGSTRTANRPVAGVLTGYFVLHLPGSLNFPSCASPAAFQPPTPNPPFLPLYSPLAGLWSSPEKATGFITGLSFVGAKFTHNLEVTFYPGEEKVHITQTADGLGPENYLSITTHIEGQLPFIPENFTVHIAPYKELYHYSHSAVTSSAYRQYFLTSGSVNQTFAYQLHQNVTFQDCPPARHHRRPPAVQLLSVDRLFALYSEEERVLRYAITNQVGSGEGGADMSAVNPCYDGTHACDTSARCQPGAGLEYTCECTAGYRGDGRDC